MPYLNPETNLTGTLARDCTASDATIYIAFKDAETGAVREPTTNPFFVAVSVGKEARYEIMVIQKTSFDGTTSTCTIVKRGLAFSGSSLTEISGNKKVHSQGERVDCSDVHYNITLLSGVTDGVFGGTAGTGANAFRVGDGTDSDIYIYFQNADVAKPGIRYNKTTNHVEWSDDGASWNYVGTGSGHGTTATLKQHADVDATVTDSPSSGEILAYDGAKWKNTTAPYVSDTAYGVGWDGVTTVAPSKNAVYDKVNGMVDDTAYDATSWNGVTTVAPSKNAVRDKIETIDGVLSKTLYQKNSTDSATNTVTETTIFDSGALGVLATPKVLKLNAILQTSVSGGATIKVKVNGTQITTFTIANVNYNSFFDYNINLITTTSQRAYGSVVKEAASAQISNALHDITTVNTASAFQLTITATNAAGSGATNCYAGMLSIL